MKKTKVKTIFDPKYERIIHKLKKARLDMDLTQEYVGEKMGRYQSFIAKVENGERRLDIIELLKLADIYNKDIKDFVNGKGK